MPVNSATLVSQLTGDKPSQKVGVVLRSCEIRALIELVKLQQANLDNLTIIGVDCLGTYEVDDTCWCWSIPADWAPRKLKRQTVSRGLAPGFFCPCLNISALGVARGLCLLSLSQRGGDKEPRGQEGHGETNQAVADHPQDDGNGMGHFLW